MSDPNPRVSIIVPARNHADYVETALDSVLAQTHPEIELIVIDDGSEDETAAVIERWLARQDRPVRIVFHRQENRGLGPTLARALALAEGEFVQFLASDDALFPQMTARLAAHLAAAGPEVAAVACDGYVFDACGGPHLPFSRLHPAPLGRDLHREMMVGNWLPAMGLMYRRAAVLAEGGIDPALAYEDWGLLLALTRRYRIEQIPDRLFLYRRHGRNSSADPARMRAALAGLTARYPQMARVRALRAALAAGDLRGILAGLRPGNLDLALRFALRQMQGWLAGRQARGAARSPKVAGVEIGPGCTLHPSARLEAGPGPLILGPGCHIGAGARLIAGPGLVLGADCLIEAGAIVGGAAAPTRLGRACLIGAGARVAPGADLGEICAVLPGAEAAGALPAGQWLIPFPPGRTAGQPSGAIGGTSPGSRREKTFSGGLSTETLP